MQHKWVGGSNPPRCVIFLLNRKGFRKGETVARLLRTTTKFRLLIYRIYSLMVFTDIIGLILFGFLKVEP